MTFVEELIDYLVSKSVISAKGTDGFYDYLPDVTTSPVVCLRDTGGLNPKLNSPVADSTIQCMVRADTFESARQKAAEVYQEFHQLVNTDLTNNHVVYAEAMSLPASIGPDKRMRHLISANYHFQTYGLASGGNGDGGGKDPNDPDIQIP